MPARHLPSVPKARILLVDDNALGLSARKCVLEELGHHITVALSGSEALDEYSSGRFDLVVTDYKMPKMDGLELIARLTEADLRATFLIQGYTVSGLEAVGQVVEHFGLHYGQIVYITKSIRGKDLGFYRELTRTGRAPEPDVNRPEGAGD